MIYLYIVLVVVISITFIKVLEYRMKRKVILRAKSYGIFDTYVIQGITYQVRFLHVPHHAKLQVNSKTVIQIKKGNDVTLIPFELTKPHLIITYPSSEKMRVVLNENEIQFFEPKQKIYETYICPSYALNTWIEGLHD
jgi:hypothetical protein